MRGSVMGPPGSTVPATGRGRPRQSQCWSCGQGLLQTNCECLHPAPSQLLIRG